MFSLTFPKLINVNIQAVFLEMSIPHKIHTTKITKLYNKNEKKKKLDFD